MVTPEDEAAQVGDEASPAAAIYSSCSLVEKVHGYQVAGDNFTDARRELAPAIKAVVL